MTTLLPTDVNNNIIPALRLKPDGAQSITFSSISTRNSISFDSDIKVISLYATNPVYIRFGDNTVTATTNDHYFPAGVYYDIALGGDAGSSHFTHIAALRAETDGILYISEKE